MKPLSDNALERLRKAADEPDLSGTKYRLLRPVGRGGMGAVFLAEDTELHRQVALKVLQVDDPAGEWEQRLWREAHVLAQLDHPNIVPIYDVGTAGDGRVFYAMKYVEGTRLDAYRDTAASQADLLRVFEKLCDAVAFAHSRGVLHRDLKPENVMVGPFGEVLVMDWGLAKRAGEPADGAIAGTAGFMAPEQASGQDPDARADVYALGVTLRFLLKGFGQPPGPLRSIVRKATATRKEDRYASAGELSAEIVRFLDQQPVLAHPETIWERGRRVARRHAALLALISVYMVVRALLLFLQRR